MIKIYQYEMFPDCEYTNFELDGYEITQVKHYQNTVEASRNWKPICFCTTVVTYKKQDKEEKL